MEEVVGAMEMSDNEQLRVDGVSFVWTKRNEEKTLTFNHYTYFSLLQQMRNIFPFLFNPTPRQYELIQKFQEEAVKQNLDATDFAYPCMTEKMTTLLKTVCKATNFCRTETFIQKHFLGLNFSSLEVYYKLTKITGPM